MPYTSPFELAGLPSDRAISPEDLKRAKAKLLAEFELKGKTTIIWEGRELDRQTVLNLLEDLANPRALHFHQTVAAYPNLAKFIGQSKWRGEAIETVRNAPEGWLEWVSPYFAEAVLAPLSSNKRPMGSLPFAAELLKGPVYLVEEDFEEAFKPFLEWLRFLCQADTDTHLTPEDRMMLNHPDFPSVIGFLPAQYLPLQEKMAHWILKKIENDAKRGFQKYIYWLDNIQDWPISDALKNKIADAQKRLPQLAENFRETQEAAYQRYGQEKQRPRNRIFALVVVVFAVGLLAYTFITKMRPANTTRQTPKDFKERLEMGIDNDLFYSKIAMAVLVDYAKDQLPADTTRPITGYVPYQSRYPNIPSCGSECISVTVKNNSPRDGVAFMQEDGQINLTYAHSYIRSGESFTFLPLSPGDFKMRWYGGRAWKEGQMKDGEDVFGAFLTDQIKPYQIDSMKDISWISLRLRTQEPELHIEVKGDSLFSDN